MSCLIRFLFPKTSKKYFKPEEDEEINPLLSSHSSTSSTKQTKRNRMVNGQIELFKFSSNIDDQSKINQQVNEEQDNDQQELDVESLDSLSNSLLHRFVNDEIKLKYLLTTKAKKYINHFNKNGETPLHIVNELNCYRLLISNGADPNARDLNNYICNGPPIFYQNKKVILIEMLKAAAPNRRGGNGTVAYHTINDPDCIDVLKDNGLDLNSTDLSGNTPLHTVRSLECAKKYIQLGLNVNTQNKDGNTPLHTCNYPCIVEYFLSLQDVDTNIKNNLGKTPFFNTIDDVYLVKLYLTLNVDPGVTDNDGKNAFDYCSNDLLCALYNSVEKNPYLVLLDDIVNLFSIKEEVKPLISKLGNSCIKCKREAKEVIKTTCNFHCELNTYCRPCISTILDNNEKCSTCDKFLCKEDVKTLIDNKYKETTSGDLLMFD